MPNYIALGNKFVPITYTTTEVDSIFDILPLSRYGDDTTDAVPASIVGSNIHIEPVPALMRGKQYNLAATDIPFTLAMDAVFRVYLRLINGVPSYYYSPDYDPETPDNMLVGTLSFDTSGDPSVYFMKVVRLDNYRLSTDAGGSVIPGTTGNPAQ